MRLLASSLLRWMTVAAYGSRRVHFRREEAEFPAASQNACRLLERPFRGRRATGCASIDALRSFNNSVNIEDQHEISLIRETSAPFAWWLPKKGRSRPASAGDARESSAENILAAFPGIFWKWPAGQEARISVAQRLAITRAPSTRSSPARTAIA